MEKIIFSVSIILFTMSYGYGQDGLWHEINNASHPRLKVEKSRTVMISSTMLAQQLRHAGSDYLHGIAIELPTPYGKRSYNVWQQSIMAPELQAAYPGITTYTATALDQPGVTAKLDMGPNGFHAMVWEEDDMYYIEPASYSDDGTYLVFYKKDYRRSVVACAFSKNNVPEQRTSTHLAVHDADQHTDLPMQSIGGIRHNYRLALSCTGEYAQAVTGSSTPSKAAVLAAMVTTMNRVNGIYERELGVSMTLIGNNDLVIYTNPSSDPFTANDDGYALLGQNQSNTTAVIGTANYDIGHIFSTGGGGIASLASVCSPSAKAQGVTGSPSPYGDAYDVDYVAHEMGHQFAANHPFNNCYGNENAATAYEPGSGSTIMAYAGLCGADNDLQPYSSDYFHAISLIEAGKFLEGTSPYGDGSVCGTTVSTGYTPISLSSTAASYRMPASTAFELQAPTATWAGAAPLTYSWEGWSKGYLDLEEDEIYGANFTVGPVFRSYPGTTSGYRSFPNRDSVLHNKYNFVGERTPEVTRSLAAKLTVRGVGPDGYGTVVVSDQQVSLNVTNTGQAFTVTSPNTAVTWVENTPQTVSWNVAGTNAAPISAANVAIYLSKDGGNTYPFSLGTFPNNGSASVVPPNGSAGVLSRIKVKGSGSVFYDVGNTNFTIQSNPTAISTPAQEQYSIYPNPASNYLNIMPRGPRPYASTIISVLGQQLQGAMHSGTVALDISSLAPGVYTLVLSEEGTAVGYYKFVVAR